MSFFDVCFRLGQPVRPECSSLPLSSFYSSFLDYLFGFWVRIVSVDIDFRVINVECDSQGESIIT